MEIVRQFKSRSHILVYSVFALFIGFVTLVTIVVSIYGVL